MTPEAPQPWASSSPINAADGRGVTSTLAAKPLAKYLGATKTTKKLIDQSVQQPKYIYIYIHIYVWYTHICILCYMRLQRYMRVVLNSFIWKTPSSPKKKFFRRTFANSMFIFRGTCWPRFLRKTWMCDILKLFQASDPLSHFILRPLHLNIYVLL